MDVPWRVDSSLKDLPFDFYRADSLRFSALVLLDLRGKKIDRTSGDHFNLRIFSSPSSLQRQPSLFLFLEQARFLLPNSHLQNCKFAELAGYLSFYFNGTQLSLMLIASRTSKVLSILISCLVGLVFTVEHYKVVEITKSKTNTIPLWSLIFLFMTCFIEILLLCSSCSAILRFLFPSYRKLRKTDIQIL